LRTDVRGWVYYRKRVVVLHNDELGIWCIRPKRKKDQSHVLGHGGDGSRDARLVEATRINIVGAKVDCDRADLMRVSLQEADRRLHLPAGIGLVKPKAMRGIRAASSHERRGRLTRASQIDGLNVRINSLKLAFEIVHVTGSERRGILGRVVGKELALLIAKRKRVTKGQVKGPGRIKFGACRRGRRRSQYEQCERGDKGEKSHSHREHLLTRPQQAAAPRCRNVSTLWVSAPVL
jgi:hypothetical protein